LTSGLSDFSRQRWCILSARDSCELFWEKAVAEAKTKAKKGAAKTSKVKASRSATEKKTSEKPASQRKPAAKRADSQAKVVMDRRSGADRRKSQNRRKKNQPVAVERRKLERRAKVNRRRQIDPTTCERDYSAAEIEFMNALDEYKRTSGRMFPTCSEILEVIGKLGYEKRPAGLPVEGSESPGVGEPQTPVDQGQPPEAADGPGEANLNDSPGRPSAAIGHGV
jgi:hypothetical protein